jgi:uncharacterized UPF0160 family protein
MKTTTETTTPAAITVKTHNGVFHADEAMAIALISLYEKKGIGRVTSTPEKSDNFINIIRTRDVTVDATYTVDVGGVYDPDNGQFDHHQSSYGGELSSAGMVLAYIKERGFESNQYIDELVKDIDANDTGRARSDRLLINAVREMNSPSDINGHTQNLNFSTALNLCQGVIRALRSDYYVFGSSPIEEATSLVLNEELLNCSNCGTVAGYCRLIIENRKEAKKLQEAIASAITSASKEGEAITFKKGDPFVPVSELIGIADICIQWDSAQECWSIQMVPLKKGEFATKYKLQPMGDEIFVHKEGFISKTKTGRYTTKF